MASPRSAPTNLLATFKTANITGMAKKSLRTSREYIHRKCRGTTEIDGPEFSALADPLANMVGTYCAECEEFFPIGEFAWADTKERISDYYKRYQQQASPSQRFLASRRGMFVMSGIAGAAGLLIGILGLKMPVIGVVLAVVAVVAMLALHTLMIGPMILKQVLGTSDPRQLD